MRLFFLTLLLCVSLGAAAIFHAQQSSVTYPIMHGNVSQWGGAAVPAAATLNDAISNPVAPLSGSTVLIWDATQWVRYKATSLTNMVPATTTTTRSIVGASLVEKSSRWTVVSTPAVSTQASASLAAEAAVRHVADCVSFSAGSTTAPALTKLNINLRDGATGAGMIINSWTVVIAAATGQNVSPFSVCGLNLTGTTNTAMTLEFSALLTNLFEDVTLTGFNVQ